MISEMNFEFNVFNLKWKIKTNNKIFIAENRNIHFNTSPLKWFNSHSDTLIFQKALENETTDFNGAYKHSKPLNKNRTRPTFETFLTKQNKNKWINFYIKNEPHVYTYLFLWTQCTEPRHFSTETNASLRDAKSEPQKINRHAKKAPRTVARQHLLRNENTYTKKP